MGGFRRFDENEQGGGKTGVESTSAYRIWYWTGDWFLELEFSIFIVIIIFIWSFITWHSFFFSFLGGCAKATAAQA